jgi:hypothetical protein
MNPIQGRRKVVHTSLPDSTKPHAAVSTSVSVFQRFYTAQNELRLRGPGAGLGLTINRRIVASRDAAISDRRGDRAGNQSQQRAARNLHKSDFVLIVPGDAPFATQLTSELAAVGVATLRASDTHSTKLLLGHRLPRPVVIDLRYAALPIPGAAAAKP